MVEDKRIKNELIFDEMIADKAEEIWHWEGCAGRIRWQRRANLIFNKINQSLSGTILELGSGTGILTQDLVNRLKNFNVYISSDISLFLLNRAKNKEYNVKENLCFLINNAYFNGIKNNSIDVLIGISVLHHLDLSKALNEFYRILKPNGIVVFTEPNYLNPHVFLERKIDYLRKKFQVTKDETAFIRWNLHNKLKQAGFSKIEIYPFDFVYPFIKSEKIIKKLIVLESILEKVSIIKELAGSLFITFEKK